MAKILIIDDEPSIRSTLASILVDEGHKTTTCESGEEGIATFAREEFDLVLLDLWLGGMDGMAVLERLIAAGGPAVIMISRHRNIRAPVPATPPGAHHFLAKPLSLQPLPLTLNQHLGGPKPRGHV